MKLCLHIHSSFSKDSRATVEEIIITANKLNYDIISITDHNTVKGSLRALELGGNHPRIIVGAEFSTQVGHVLAYDIDETVELETKKINDGQFDFEDLMHHIKKVGGSVFLAHPANSKIDIYYEELGLFDGVERYNSRLDSFIWKSKSETLVKECLACYELISIGAPDAHSTGEMSNCYMEIEGQESGSLLEILQQNASIHIKKAQNLSVALTELKNIEGLRFKKIIKIMLRSLIGSYEIVRHLKEKRYSSYDIIQLGEKSK